MAQKERVVSLRPLSSGRPFQAHLLSSCPHTQALQDPETPSICLSPVQNCSVPAKSLQVHKVRMILRAYGRWSGVCWMVSMSGQS